MYIIHHFLNIKFWITNKAYYKISNISVCETEVKFWKYRNTLPDVTSWKRFYSIDAIRCPAAAVLDTQSIRPVAQKLNLGH